MAETGDTPQASAPREPAFNASKYDRFGFTGQQRDALHHYLTDCDLEPVRALMAAGYSEAWAKANGAEFFKSAKFSNFLENHYSKEAVRGGIWQFYFRLLQALSATKLQKIGQGSGVRAKVDTKEVPDWQTRINALVQAFKVFGEYAPTKVNVEGDLLAGKTDEEKASAVREAEAILKRVLAVGSRGAEDGEGESDA